MKAQIRVVQTSRDNFKPWQELEMLELSSGEDFCADGVMVDSSKTFQTHMGFGGAFTEASAYTLANTNAKNRKEIISAYFNKETGLAYNLGRTAIHTCDFALEPYTYIEEGDSELETFDISREEQWVIPFIEEAQEKAKEKIILLCSPWSPPAFMKNNNDINNGGNLLKEYYPNWAKYVVKYIQEMEKRGIKMSMVSVQNEPAAKQIWASCKFNPTEEAEFAVDYLYPALKEAKLADRVKILICDHNRDIMYDRVRESMRYPGAEDVIWGVAYHIYGPEDFINLKKVHDDYPEKRLIFTEGCVELTNDLTSTSSKYEMGAWEHGEMYGRNIINDFNHYCEGWIDWNLLLNEIGGPNYVGNYCEAPILVDRNRDEIVYNMSYYYIGHFSRYIKPGAKRLQCSSGAEKVYATAYRNPSGDIVVVVQNEMDTFYKMALEIDGKKANTNLPAHSITTFILSEE